MVETSVIAQAAQAINEKRVHRPAPENLVAALLQAERSAKKAKLSHCFSQFIGTWRLGFITGTRKTRQRAGVLLGTGRYLPSVIKITLSYDPLPGSQFDLLSIDPASIPYEVGQIRNQVDLGILNISLTGPAKLLSPRTIMAFDFTHLSIQSMGAKLLDRGIRGGETTIPTFFQEGVGKQAFFAYFLVEDQFLAARGRGGGLALWSRGD